MNNLSSERQTVDLDFAAWAGSKPVDLFTGQECARVTAGLHRFELRRYQYYWVQLH